LNQDCAFVLGFESMSLADAEKILFDSIGQKAKNSGQVFSLPDWPRKREVEDCVSKAIERLGEQLCRVCSMAI
jgi:hypothetical protein